MIYVSHYSTVLWFSNNKVVGIVNNCQNASELSSIFQSSVDWASYFFGYKLFLNCSCTSGLMCYTFWSEKEQTTNLILSTFVLKGELYCHVTTKFAEAGSILGTIIGGGIGAVKSHMTLAGGAASGCRNGMLVGIPLGLFATYMAMRNVEKVILYTASVFLTSLNAVYLRCHYSSVLSQPLLIVSMGFIRYWILVH